MPPKFFSWIFFYAFLALSITLAIVLFWPGRGVLLPALTPKPETFTELYFEDHLNLPKRVVVGQENSFSFTIHNLEGKNVNYPLEVTVINEASSSTMTIFKGAVVVGDQESKTLPITYVIPEGLGEKIKIEVFLKNLNQRIFFRFDTTSINANVSNSLKQSSASTQASDLVVPASISGSVAKTKSATESPQIFLP